MLDGGMGYELTLRGVNVPSHLDSIWSAQALFDDPESVVSVHVDYIEAGADILTINNYAVTPQLLARAGREDRVEELTIRAVELAERACEVAGRRPKIAGSLPPLETTYRTDLIKGRTETLDSYRRIADVLAGRVDLILCETMASSQEAVWAATVASESGCEYWVSWTLQGDRPDTLPSGEGIDDAFEALGGLDPSSYLINCCGANFVAGALSRLSHLTDKPIGAYANAECVTPGPRSAGPDHDAEARQRESSVRLGPDDYAAEVRQWIDAGASIVGGCCGTRPEHIRRLRELLDESPGI